MVAVAWITKRRRTSFRAASAVKTLLVTAAVLLLSVLLRCSEAFVVSSHLPLATPSLGSSTASTVAAGTPAGTTAQAGTNVRTRIDARRERMATLAKARRCFFGVGEGLGSSSALRISSGSGGDGARAARMAAEEQGARKGPLGRVRRAVARVLRRGGGGGGQVRACSRAPVHPQLQVVLEWIASVLRFTLISLHII